MEYKSYKDYEQHAINILGKSRLPVNNENIGIVITNLLLAKEKYKPEIGTFKGFLEMYIVFAVKTIRTRLKKSKNKNTLLFSEMSDESFLKNIKAKEKPRDIFSEIIQNKSLTDLEKTIILRVFRNGDKVTQIAKELNTTRQWINKIKQNTLIKLKQNL